MGLRRSGSSSSSRASTTASSRSCCSWRSSWAGGGSTWGTRRRSACAIHRGRPDLLRGLLIGVVGVGIGVGRMLARRGDGPRPALRAGEDGGQGDRGARGCGRRRDRRGGAVPWRAAAPVRHRHGIDARRAPDARRSTRWCTRCVRAGRSRHIPWRASIARVGLFAPLADAIVVPSIVGLFGLGLVLAWARLRTGSLWISIGIHAAYVAVFRVGRLVFDILKTPAWLIGPGWPPLDRRRRGRIALAVAVTALAAGRRPATSRRFAAVRGRLYVRRLTYAARDRVHRRRLRRQSRARRLGGASSIAATTGASCRATMPATTNNRMEMTAAHRGAAQRCRSRATVDLHTDSQYLRNGMSTWLARWKRNGWRTADRKPVKNEDLWRALDDAGAAARGALALGARPRRTSRERALRRARQRRHPGPSRQRQRLAGAPRDARGAPYGVLAIADRRCAGRLRQRGAGLASRSMATRSTGSRRGRPRAGAAVLVRWRAGRGSRAT